MQIGIEVVSLELAKLIRKKGFKAQTEYYYLPDPNLKTSHLHNLVHKSHMFGYSDIGEAMQYEDTYLRNTFYAPSYIELINWIIPKVKRRKGIRRRYKVFKYWYRQIPMKEYKLLLIFKLLICWRKK